MDSAGDEESLKKNCSGVIEIDLAHNQLTQWSEVSVFNECDVNRKVRRQFQPHLIFLHTKQIYCILSFFNVALRYDMNALDE